MYSMWNPNMKDCEEDEKEIKTDMKNQAMLAAN